MGNNKNAFMGFIAFGVLAVLIGKALLSEPRCQRGCRTLAEHLIQHGIDNIIKGFLA
jgi:hypothetical protein